MPRGRKKKVVEETTERVEAEALPVADTEVMGENEVDSMFEKAVERKEEVKRKAEDAVDSQEWTRQDPDIPEALKGRVWIAVFKCEKGHKTKATNRQADTGIYCWQCRVEGVKSRADMMPIFRGAPEDQSKKTDVKRKEMNKRGR